MTWKFFARKDCGVGKGGIGGGDNGIGDRYVVVVLLTAMGR